MTHPCPFVAAYQDADLTRARAIADDTPNGITDDQFNELVSLCGRDEFVNPPEGAPPIHAPGTV